MKSIFWMVFLGLVLGPSWVWSDPEGDLIREAHRQTEAIRKGGQDWPILETEFFRIRYQPGLKPDPVAGSELDRFMGNILEKLDGTGRLETETRTFLIDYYLCDDSTVQRLTGHATKGMADLAGRAPTHLPHSFPDCFLGQ